MPDSLRSKTEQDVLAAYRQHRHPLLMPPIEPLERQPRWVRAIPFGCMALILLALYSAFLGLCWLIFRTFPPEGPPVTFWQQAKDPSIVFWGSYVGIALLWSVGWLLDRFCWPEDE